MSDEVKYIHEVNELSDAYYWKEIFPNSYKKRKITPMTWMPSVKGSLLYADGDIRFELIDSDHVCFCNICNSKINRLSCKLFGSIDVGRQLVYMCPSCNAKARLYNMTEDEYNHKVASLESTVDESL